MRRPLAVAALAAALCLPPAYSLTSAQAAPADGAAASVAVAVGAHQNLAKRSSRITARFPTGSRRAGSTALVTGTLTGNARRDVQIQAKGTNGTWVRLTSVRTRSDGRFTARAPTWWVARQKLRAYAPATNGDAATAMTSAGTITVRRTYAPRAGKGFSYLLGVKARWNPCQVISYRVNPRHLPAHGLARVRNAFRAVSQATGLRFTYGGSTTFVPFKRGQSGNAHVAHADIGVAWSTPAVVPTLAGVTLGMGGAQGTRVDGGPMQLHNGAVVFDATQRLQGSRTVIRNLSQTILLHELGHVVGLGHTPDARQIMSPTLPSSAPHYAHGDLRGLASVGAKGGCIADSVR